MAKQFVLARVTDMRGVDLSVFDFDFDLTWGGFFMNANQHIYGRYGGRDEGHAEKALSLAGLKYAMKQALQKHQRSSNAKATPIARKIRFVEKFPGARRVKKKQCIHCHQVHDYRREWQVVNGTWSRDDIWMFPPPRNIGISLDVKQGDRIAKIEAGSAATRAGLQPGDVLQTVGGAEVASYGDVQYALNKAPKSGQVPLTWQRQGRTMQAKLTLKEGWRKNDFSWRGSMWTLEPRSEVYGRDLTAAQKRKLGLAAKRLAFRQGNYVPPNSRRAGVRGGDIIIGADGKELEMTMLQFNVWIRLNYRNGDRIVYNVLRNGRRMDFSMVFRSYYKP